MKVCFCILSFSSSFLLLSFLSCFSFLFHFPEWGRGNWMKNGSLWVITSFKMKVVSGRRIVKIPFLSRCPPHHFHRKKKRKIERNGKRDHSFSFPPPHSFSFPWFVLSFISTWSERTFQSILLFCISFWRKNFFSLSHTQLESLMMMRSEVSSWELHPFRFFLEERKFLFPSSLIIDNHFTPQEILIQEVKSCSERGVLGEDVWRNERRRKLLTSFIPLHLNTFDRRGSWLGDK